MLHNEGILCQNYWPNSGKRHLEIQSNYMCFKVLVTDPEKLDGIRQRESDLTKEKIQKILAAGANVILCTGGIDDLCLKVI